MFGIGKVKSPGDSTTLTIQEFEMKYHTKITGHKDYLKGMAQTTQQTKIILQKSPEVQEFKDLLEAWSNLLTTTAPPFQINPSKREVIITQPVFKDAEVQTPLVLTDSDGAVFTIFPVNHQGKIYYYILNSLLNEEYKMFNPEQIAVNTILRGDIEKINILHFLSTNAIITGLLDYIFEGIKTIIQEEHLPLGEFLDNILASATVMVDNGEPTTLIRVFLKDSGFSADLHIKDSFLTMENTTEFYNILEKENYIYYYLATILTAMSYYIALSDFLKNTLVVPTMALGIDTHKGKIRLLYGSKYKEFQIPEEYLRTGDEEMITTYIAEKVIPSLYQPIDEFHVGMHTLIREE